MYQDVSTAKCIKDQVGGSRINTEVTWKHVSLQEQLQPITAGSHSSYQLTELTSLLQNLQSSLRV